MSDQRGSRSSNVRSATRARGSSQQTFEEQERQRIKQLKESLLGGASVSLPPQVSPAVSSSLIQRLNEVSENSAEDSEHVTRHVIAPAVVDAGLSAPIDLPGESDIRSEKRDFPRMPK